MFAAFDHGYHAEPSTVLASPFSPDLPIKYVQEMPEIL